MKMIIVHAVNGSTTFMSWAGDGHVWILRRLAGFRFIGARA